MGDRALLAVFGEEIDPVINARVRGIAQLLEMHNPPGLTAVVPAYASLTVLYDPLVLPVGKIATILNGLMNYLDLLDARGGERVEIPVCYGGEFGPDMATVVSVTGLDEEEVIRRHIAVDYPIYMVGFTPGFPFLGGMDPALATPRLENPRSVVPAGSVGIANNQTGMYSVDSPGGWQLIGRTPIKLFDPSRENPFLYKAGDRIRFVPITPEEFGDLAQGEFEEST